MGSILALHSGFTPVCAQDVRDFETGIAVCKASNLHSLLSLGPHFIFISEPHLAELAGYSWPSYFGDHS